MRLSRTTAKRGSSRTKSRKILTKSTVSPATVKTHSFPLGPSWNVIVGKNFGSHVVHQTKSYIFASYGDDEIYILLWKSG